MAHGEELDSTVIELYHLVDSLETMANGSTLHPQGRIRVRFELKEPLTESQAELLKTYAFEKGYQTIYRKIIKDPYTGRNMSDLEFLR